MENLTTLLTSAVLGGLFASGILKLFLDKSLSAILNRALHERKIGGKAELVYREKQLEEFYGPIYSYLESNKIIYPLWLEGKLKEINYEIILMFIQQNNHINEIITNKAHLIDGGQMPEEFTAFTTSSKIWSMYCIREDEPFLPSHIADLQQVKWPERFEEHIHNKTIELKKELNEMYKKHSIHKS